MKQEANVAPLHACFLQSNRDTGISGGTICCQFCKPPTDKVAEGQSLNAIKLQELQRSVFAAVRKQRRLQVLCKTRTENPDQSL